MLRRVTPTRVSVFVVTTEACDVTVVVREAGQQVATGPASRTRTFGALLHATVATAEANGAPLIAEVVYSYDVQLTRVSPAASAVGLADQRGLLTGACPLGYREGELPTFALPPSLQHLHVVHASCRKPHGGGPDALAIVDRLIAKVHGDQSISGTPEDARLRPHQLLLTGDQIYADDVAVSLLPVLIDVGGLLLGEAVKERYPGDVVMTAADVKPGYARGVYLAWHTKLSGDAMENHLMYLAEFFAMYVMAWSDELWARDDEDVPQLEDLNVDAFYPEPHWLPLADLALKERRKQAPEDHAEVLSFARSVRRVRRALANVPTMMMFDDHEVSDDWNIDAGWAQDSRTDPGTHRVVRNGLLAQAVFQAWGNAPDRFGAGVGKELLDLISVPPGELATPLQVRPAAADTLLDIAVGGPALPAARVRWDWTLDGVQHRVIALDTRTHRDFESAGRAKPGLLTEAEMQRQLSAHRPADPGWLAMVIAPAPVMGHPLVEEVLQRMLSSADNGRAVDNEAWAVNRRCFESFLRRLAAFGRVVLVSGDVHYGFSSHTAYFGAMSQGPARFVQLCSSAAKNADTKTLLVQSGGFLRMAGRGWFGFSTPITDDNGATLRAGLLAGAEANSFDRSLRGLYFKLLIEDRLALPPVLPSGPWHTDAATSQMTQIVALGRPDDWAYQIFYLRDARTGEKRLADARITDATPLGKASRDCVQGTAGTVVGQPNIGQVRLRLTQGRLEVVHRLHWMVPAPDLDQETAVVTYTEHVAPLTAPTAAERPTVFKVRP